MVVGTRETLHPGITLANRLHSNCEPVSRGGGGQLVRARCLASTGRVTLVSGTTLLQINALAGPRWAYQRSEN